jgi:hypothetical protein
VLCFFFQLRSLHISKDVSHDFNDLVLNVECQIPMTSFQGKQWVVSYGHYRIVGDSFTHNFQEIILTLGTTGSVVKIVK